MNHCYPAALGRLAVCLILCLTAPGWGEDSFLRNEFGARALGMGGACSAVADDPQAALWNPAGLAQLRQASLSGSQNHLSFTQNIFAVSFNVPVGVWGTFALSIQQLNVDNVALVRPVLDSNGNPVLDPMTNQPLVEITGFGQETDATFHLGYGVALSSWLLVGGAGKVMRGKVGSVLGDGTGADAGVIIKFHEAWRFGCVAEDIGRTAVRWRDGTRTIMEPAGRAGVAWEPSDKWLISGEARTPLLKTRVTSAFGAEWRYTKHVILRLGAEDLHMSGGAGFRMPLGTGKSLASADYAFVTGGGSEDRNRLTVGIVF